MPAVLTVYIKTCFIFVFKHNISEAWVRVCVCMFTLKSHKINEEKPTNIVSNEIHGWLDGWMNEWMNVWLIFLKHQTLKTPRTFNTQLTDVVLLTLLRKNKTNLCKRTRRFLFIIKQYFFVITNEHLQIQLPPPAELLVCVSLCQSDGWSSVEFIYF